MPEKQEPMAESGEPAQFSNFSVFSVGGGPAAKRRRVDDFYETPPSAVVALLAAEREAISAHLDGWPIWEPSAGRGAISGVLADSGFSVFSSDLKDRGLPGAVQMDFFDFRPSDVPSRVIITNPPYNLCGKPGAASVGRRWWFSHAQALGVRYMALLLPAAWDAARARQKLFAEWAPARRLVLPWRLEYTGGGNSTATSAWFVWDGRARETQTRILELPEGAAAMDDAFLEDRRRIDGENLPPP